MDKQEIQETSDQRKIKELESQLFDINTQMNSVIFANSKLGYSTKLMSEFHMSQEEKMIAADMFDNAKNTEEVKRVYENFKNTFFNKALNEESSDFQWTPGFKDKLRHYFAVSNGYDIVSEIRDNLLVITEYFALENKIRTTPDTAVRQPMTDRLLKDREQTLISLDKIINIINSFNEES
jgi:hypothetical protein